jgi:hypothetical protein
MRPDVMPSARWHAHGAGASVREAHVVGIGAGKIDPGEQRDLNGCHCLHHRKVRNIRPLQHRAIAEC